MKNDEKGKKGDGRSFSAWTTQVLCACGMADWLQPKRVRRRLAAARFGQGQYDSMPEYPVRWYHCKVKSTPAGPMRVVAGLSVSGSGFAGTV